MYFPETTKGVQRRHLWAWTLPCATNGEASTKVGSFWAWQSRKHSQTKIPRFIAVGVPLYHKSDHKGVLEPWNNISASTTSIEIQAGQRVGTLTPAMEASKVAAVNKTNICVFLMKTLSYFYQAFVLGMMPQAR